PPFRSAAPILVGLKIRSQGWSFRVKTARCERGMRSMSTKDIIKRARGFSKPFQVTDGSDFRLKDIDPGDTLDLGSEDKPRAREALATGVAALAVLQDM